MISDGLDDIEVFFPWYPENPINTLILEGGNEQVGAFEH